MPFSTPSSHRPQRPPVTVLIRRFPQFQNPSFRRRFKQARSESVETRTTVKSAARTKNAQGGEGTEWLGGADCASEGHSSFELKNFGKSGNFGKSFTSFRRYRLSSNSSSAHHSPLMATLLLRRSLQLREFTSLSSFSFASLAEKSQPSPLLGSRFSSLIRPFSSRPVGNDATGIDLGTTNPCAAVMEGKVLYLYELKIGLSSSEIDYTFVALVSICLLSFVLADQQDCSGYAL